MDSPGLPEAEIQEAYRVLARVNRQFFGGRRVILREFGRHIAEERPQTLSWLDVGSGSGDLPGEVATGSEAAGVRSVVLALDRDPTALAMARHSGLPAARGDALRLPFGSASIDVVSAVKFAHHFAEPAPLIAEMARVARRRVVVLDIRRDWVAYWGFVAWSRVFTTNRLVRYDGPLSVLRGFTAGELLETTSRLPAFRWTARRYAGFQLALVGVRESIG